MESKSKNFISGGSKEQTLDYPKTTEDKLVFLQQEIDNQYRVFAEETKEIKKSIEKVHKELLAHTAVLYMKFAKLDEKGETDLSKLISQMANNSLLDIKTSIALLKDFQNKTTLDLFTMKQEIDNFYKQVGERKCQKKKAK